MGILSIIHVLKQKGDYFLPGDITKSFIPDWRGTAHTVRGWGANPAGVPGGNISFGPAQACFSFSSRRFSPAKVLFDPKILPFAPEE